MAAFVCLFRKGVPMITPFRAGLLAGLVGFAAGLGAGLAIDLRDRPEKVADATPRVTMAGGIFFKAKDPAALQAWYQEHLGLEPYQAEGHVNLCWRDAGTGEMGRTVWGPFPEETAYFDPGTRDFMFNYRVNDLDGLLENLKTAGITQVGELEEYPYGRFAWVLDPEGNKVELWQPIEEDYDWKVVCGE